MWKLSFRASSLNCSICCFLTEGKKSLGLHFATPFRVNTQSRWSAVSVLRVLKNPIYIGILIQGKNTTPSYKVKKRVEKPCEEWAVIEDNHEPIVDRYDFESVQKVLALDTRTSPGSGTVEFFSGLVFCGECGASMIRKTVPSGKKKYVYYVCAAHKNEKNCSPHSLRDSALEEIVLESLQCHIQDVIDLSDLLELTDAAPLQQATIKKLQGRLDKKQEEIDRYQVLLRSLYENLTDGVLDREEYQDLKKTYTARRTEVEEQTEAIREEISLAKESHSDGRGWMEQFRKHQNIVGLDRAILVSLVERVMIFKGQRVEIIYRWHNEFQWQMDLLLQTQALPEKEAI